MAELFGRLLDLKNNTYRKYLSVMAIILLLLYYIKLVHPGTMQDLLDIIALLAKRLNYSEWEALINVVYYLLVYLTLLVFIAYMYLLVINGDWKRRLGGFKIYFVRKNFFRMMGNLLINVAITHLITVGYFVLLDVQYSLSLPALMISVLVFVFLFFWVIAFLYDHSETSWNWME
ncbi:hypothetical protein D3P09_03255 [Paenibacillus pinisoli]|uniref:Uncharacterized protein n=1 Tax=Paenibacillus pinisoli TaxID=1276110 RepID=A0A3A6Q0H7_9BACL|nr:hypothetical protein [Paenibacillus pinisoli]RJX41043.1 hypothetical protein D3P09_03255 [Paenibacillus pinisoli]